LPPTHSLCYTPLQATIIRITGGKAYGYTNTTV
jgi:hypothetical protein